MTLIITITKYNTQHNKTSVVTLSVVSLSVIELSVIVLNLLILSVTSESNILSCVSLILRVPSRLRKLRVVVPNVSAP